MTRRLTIAPLLLLILIASIGMPVNIHSCVMAGTSEKSSSCGVCDASHESDASEGQTGGCCDNRLEIEHADPAISIKTMNGVAPLQLLALLPWPVPPASDALNIGGLYSSRIHGPPPGAAPRAVWLLHSSFLL